MSASWPSLPLLDSSGKICIAGGESVSSLEFVYLTLIANHLNKCKDWRSTTSVLAPTESQRFRTAVFRMITFHVVFQLKRFRGLRLCNDPDTAEDLSAAAERRRQLGKDARVYLSRFSDNELLHLREFFEFQNSVWFWLVHKVAYSRECFL